MKRAAPVLFAALLICTLTCPALAAEPAEGTPPPKQTAAFYPAEVRDCLLYTSDAADEL